MKGKLSTVISTYIFFEKGCALNNGVQPIITRKLLLYHMGIV